MAEMVGAGVTEGLQPDTRHGVEAELALADQARNGLGSSMPNVVPHKLGSTSDELQAQAAGSTVPKVVDNEAELDAAQALMQPTLVDPVASGVLHHHAHHAVHQLSDPVVHQGPHTHVEQVMPQTIPGSADPAVGVQPGVEVGVSEATLPDSADLSTENHEKHSGAHLRDGQEPGAAHDGIFGHHNAVLPQTADYGGSLSQLLSFGAPVACVFAAVAFVLWKRLGDSRPLTSSV